MWHPQHEESSLCQLLPGCSRDVLHPCVVPCTDISMLQSRVLCRACSRVLPAKYETTKEVRLVFDRYDIATSLKEATREKRQAGQDPIYYRITDATLITKVPMKRLLSHPKTKMELTIYLAGKTLEHARQSTRPFVVAWGSQCRATHKDVEHLQRNHEEADTKMILHAVDATSDGAAEIKIHSPDTDVLVLALRRYAMLCR